MITWLIITWSIFKNPKIAGKNGRSLALLTLFWDGVGNNHTYPYVKNKKRPDMAQSLGPILALVYKFMSTMEILLFQYFIWNSVENW